MSTTITSNDPTITAERSFKDLDLNFTAHPIKKDVSRHYNEKAIINAVKNLVSTNFYEKPFQPDFGAGIRGLLFEPVDSVFGASIERKLSETIKIMNQEWQSNLLLPYLHQMRMDIKLKWYSILSIRQIQ
jgi:hypothetical protein